MENDPEEITGGEKSGPHNMAPFDASGLADKAKLITPDQFLQKIAKLNRMAQVGGRTHLIEVAADPAIETWNIFRTAKKTVLDDGTIEKTNYHHYMVTLPYSHLAIEDDEIVLGELRHELGHAFYTDWSLCEKLMETAVREGYPAEEMHQTLNSLEDPRQEHVSALPASREGHVRRFFWAKNKNLILGRLEENIAASPATVQFDTLMKLNALWALHAEDAAKEGLSPWDGTTSLTPDVRAAWEQAGPAVEKLVGYGSCRIPEMRSSEIGRLVTEVIWPQKKALIDKAGKKETVQGSPGSGDGKTGASMKGKGDSPDSKNNESDSGGSDKDKENSKDPANDKSKQNDSGKDKDKGKDGGRAQKPEKREKKTPDQQGGKSSPKKQGDSGKTGGKNSRKKEHGDKNGANNSQKTEDGEKDGESPGEAGGLTAYRNQDDLSSFPPDVRELFRQMLKARDGKLERESRERQRQKQNAMRNNAPLEAAMNLRKCEKYGINDLKTMKRYEKMSGQAKRVKNDMRRIFETYFPKIAYPKEKYGHKGRSYCHREHLKRIGSGMEKPMAVPNEPERSGLVLQIIVDVSGSMYRNHRIKPVIEMVIGTLEAALDFPIFTEVLASDHNYGAIDERYILKEFDQDFAGPAGGKVKKKLLDAMKIFGGENKDAESLAWAVPRVINKRAELRADYDNLIALVIFLSDAEFPGQQDPDVVNTLRKKVPILGGVIDPNPKIKRAVQIAYGPIGEGCFCPDSLGELATEFRKVIRKTIRHMFTTK